MKIKLTVVLSVLAVGFLLTNNVSAAIPEIGSVLPPRGIDQSPDAIQNYVPTVMNLSFFIGLIATLAFMLYGGIRWIMGGGDPKALAAAKETIVQAIIGLILLSVAYAIATLLNVLLGAPSGGSGGRSNGYRDQSGNVVDYVDLRRCGCNNENCSVNEQVQCETPYSGGRMSLTDYNALPGNQRAQLCPASVVGDPTAGGSCAAKCEANHRRGDYAQCRPLNNLRP